MQSKKVIGNQAAVAFSLFPVFGHTQEVNVYFLIYVNSMLFIKTIFSSIS
jgi:hypothetical protein